MPLPANSTGITMDSRFNEENNLESQVMFGHLESTLAVRCLARNEMATVSREVKLVSNGNNTFNVTTLFMAVTVITYLTLHKVTNTTCNA